MRKTETKKYKTRKVICGHCGNMSHVSIPDMSEQSNYSSILLRRSVLRKSVSCPYCKVVYFSEGGKWIAQVPVELEMVK